MEEEIALDRRYEEIRGCINRLLNYMNRSGLTKRLRMHRSSQAFDLQPLKAKFDAILTNGREKQIQ